MPTIQNLIDFVKEDQISILVGSNLSTDINGANNVFDASESEITFISTKYQDNWREIVSKCNAGVIFVDHKLIENDEEIVSDSTICISKDPKASLLYFAKAFLLEKKEHTISEKADIHPSVKIGKNVRIDAFCQIEKGVSIGDGTIIESNVKIGENSQIGKNVIIKSSSVIGGSGFGYVKNSDNTYEHLPHFGKVIIEDDVHIGSNTSIDRGSLSNTIIRKGVKIDNLVHIAHNVDIGENSLVIACSMIAGSVVIGKNVWIAPAATLRNAIQIGEESTIGLGAVVTKSVQDATTVLGNPATTLDEYKQFRAAQKRMLDN